MHHDSPFYLAPADSVRAPDAPASSALPSHARRAGGGSVQGGFGGGM
ncbi:hypothetical protein [Lichenicoccus sp.]